MRRSLGTAQEGKAPLVTAGLGSTGPAERANPLA